MSAACNHSVWSAQADGKTLKCVACGVPWQQPAPVDRRALEEQRTAFELAQAAEDAAQNVVRVAGQAAGHVRTVLSYAAQLRSKIAAGDLHGALGRLAFLLKHLGYFHGAAGDVAGEDLHGAL